MLPNLKLLRKESGISQQKLADSIGMSQQSINQYENHSVEPDIETLSRMADFFNTSIDYIVGRSTSRFPAEASEAFYLNENEARFMKQYRSLSQRERWCVNQVLETLAER